MAEDKIVDFVPQNAETVLIVDDKCADEITTIVSESGRYEKFNADYKARLKILFQHRENAFLFNSQWFEHLKYGKKSMYSMHMASIDNLRILYVVRSRIIFLCAFKEKQGKGRNRQSYKQYTPVAEKRLEQYEEV